MIKKKSESKIRLPARASVWYVGASVISKGAGIAATPFFTRLQSEEEYGNFTLYISILGALSIVASAFSSGSSIYKGLADSGEKRGEYLRSATAVSLGFSLIICLLLFAFSSFFGLSTVMVTLISLQLLCDSIVAIRLSEGRFLYRYREVAVITVAEAVVAPAIAIIIFTRFGGGYTVRAYSMLAVSLVTAVFALLRIFKDWGEKSRKRLYSIKSSLSLLPHSISSAVSSQADKLIFTAILGTAALAKYSVAHSLGVGLLFVVSALGSALNPWIMRRLRDGDLVRIREVCEVCFISLSAATVGVVALAPEIMKILAPIEYSEAIGAVLPSALSVPASFMISLCTLVLVHSERAGKTATVSMLTVFSSVASSFVLIPRLEYLGAGLALLISQIIGAACSLIFVNEAGYSGLFSLKKFSIYLTGFGAVALCAALLSDSPALRVLLLTVPAFAMLNSLFSAERLVRE